ncbi:MAG: Gfo/Idh/MocA family oxidoreductase [bacterium]|nr:Gfo/Idh/MocA family oxidoreductase [bacterium]
MEADKLNLLIIGNGHYATGCTVLDGRKETDKDFGVLLPSVLELARQGLVGRIFLAGRDGGKFAQLRGKLEILRQQYGWDTEVALLPADGVRDEFAYREALKQIPRPAAALIAVPDNLHRQVILDCIDAGLHFLVVKPAVTTTSDHRDLVVQLQGKRLLGMVDYHKVFDEANVILRNQLAEHQLGHIYHVFSRMSQRRDMLEIFGPWLKASGTNINHYLGSHYIHLTGFLTGANPVAVRATGQYGIARRDHGIDTPDMIQTRDLGPSEGYRFASYHLAGWTDPVDTPGMTYQEIGLIGEKGNIHSDQRFRGLQTQLAGSGYQTVNPYFFTFHRDHSGRPDLDGKYGFKSIKTFVTSAWRSRMDAIPPPSTGPCRRLPSLPV